MSFFQNVFGTKQATAAQQTLPSLEQLGDVRGKRVLLRVSVNVPVVNGHIENAFRLKSALPMIKTLVKRGARVVLLGHIGRDMTETLRPVHDALGQDVPMKAFLPLEGDETTAVIEGLQDGEVVMLENVRSHAGEETNDPVFAATLAAYGEYYINDAFSDSHREHASVVGIPEILPSCFGEMFIKEYEALAHAMQPKTPSLLILGGAKFETKLPLIEKYAHIYDHIFVTGALANDFFKAKGYEVGTSLVSDKDFALASLLANKKILLPTDVTVQGKAGVRVTTPDDVHTDESMLDVGPETIAMLVPYIKDAKTILWNGPLGNYEKGFAKYTEECAKLVAKSGAYSVVGGGDTIATIDGSGMSGEFGFLSTAGGAMLVFLESGTLPAIDSIIG